MQNQLQCEIEFFLYKDCCRNNLEEKIKLKVVIRDLTPPPLKIRYFCQTMPTTVYYWWRHSTLVNYICTATKIPFSVCIPFLVIARPQSQFPHSCVCDRFTYFLQQNRRADPSWEYINRSQTHECGNWDCGRAIPFLGIVVSNFRNWFFAVCENNFELTQYSLCLSFLQRCVALTSSALGPNL